MSVKMLKVVHNLIVLRDASEQIATSATAADSDRAEAPADAAPAVDPVEEERQANIQMLTVSLWAGMKQISCRTWASPENV